LFEVIQKKLRLVGKLPEREGATIHERLDVASAKTSHHHLSMPQQGYTRAAAGSNAARSSIRRFFCS